MGLLNEIEADATNSSVPTVDLLRKCKVLAARLKHKELADWASAELNGYSDTNKLPSYRCHPHSSPVGSFVASYGGGQLNGVPIPLSTIPQELHDHVAVLRFSQPIAEIEELSSQRENLQRQWSGDIIGRLQRVPIYEDYVILEAHSIIPSAMLKGIVDTVRTRLLDYVLAIQAENPEADAATPSDPPPISASTLHQTFHTTIVGGQANVGGHGVQSISDIKNENVGNMQNTNQVIDENIVNLLKEIRQGAARLSEDDRADATNALERIEIQLQKPRPDLGRIKSYLEIVGSLVQLAPAANKLYEYLVKFF